MHNNPENQETQYFCRCNRAEMENREINSTINDNSGVANAVRNTTHPILGNNRGRFTSKLIQKGLKIHKTCS